MGEMTKRVLCFDSSASTDKLSTHTHTNSYRFMLMKRDLSDLQTRDDMVHRDVLVHRVRWSCDVMWTLYHFRDAGVPFFVEAIFGLAPQKACCCDRSERRVLKE